ncbi:O-acetyl-ADP-ribose deacetylase 1-like [Poecilia latipinna]|uniref:O-acyl-ADP-ribose deacylase 1 n=2 Tax=Poecilia TaxID=8080 RepID=A0A087XPI2_POEFO|nr:PREDICTED: O-acetyl-ADP-ribose deacetylase 1-like [Poecilia formosa]XP_014870493.1 PREDICTED: O-acetyl-ADP-ribose deacetylase 1-like [Poecilia latipinna]
MRIVLRSVACLLRQRCSRILLLNPVNKQDLNTMSSVSSNSRAPSSTYKIQLSEDSWTLKYATGDLFSCPRDESLAHCISEDIRMGAGIAVTFRKRFGEVLTLKEQKKVPGQCAVLTHDRRFIYYLITKKKASQKPTYDSLRRSLEDMKTHCLQNGVKRISIPRIGCGLDRLQWSKVSQILEQVFKETDITITVYSLPKKAETTVMKENMR